MGTTFGTAAPAKPADLTSYRPDTWQPIHFDAPPAARSQHLRGSVSRAIDEYREYGRHVSGRVLEDFDRRHQNILQMYKDSGRSLPLLDAAIKVLGDLGEPETLLSRDKTRRINLDAACENVEHELYVNPAVYDYAEYNRRVEVNGEHVQVFSLFNKISEQFVDALVFPSVGSARAYASLGMDLQEQDPDADMHMPLLTRKAYPATELRVDKRMKATDFMVMQLGRAPSLTKTIAEGIANVPFFANSVYKFLTELQSVGNELGRGLDPSTTTDDLTYANHKRQKMRLQSLQKLVHPQFSIYVMHRVPDGIALPIVEVLKANYAAAASTNFKAKTYFLRLESVVDMEDFAKLVQAASLVPHAPWDARTITEIMRERRVDLGGRRRRRHYW